MPPKPTLESERAEFSRVVPHAGLLLLLALSVLGALTVFTHIAQYAHITFRTYAIVVPVLALAVAAICCFGLRSVLAALERPDWRRLLLVVGICSLGSVLALLVNRPAEDDFFYASNAVYYAQHPLAQLGHEIHYLHSGAQPFRSVFWATSGPYEYVQAVLAYWLEIDYLTVYYLLGPAIIGFMIPLAFFLLLSHFSESIVSAAVGTMVILAAITLLGETPRTFGSHSFARAYQGLVLDLAVVPSLFAALSLDFFRRPTKRSWMSIFGLVTVAVGASSSAVYLLPPLAVMLAMAHTMTATRILPALRRLACYFASMAYLAGYAVLILNAGAADLGANSQANIGWPTTFAGHLELLLNPIAPVTPIALVLSSALAVWLLQGPPRRLLASWILAALVLFLNPVVAPFLITNLTTPNSYWRLFYIFPFPLSVGIVAATIHSRARALPVGRQLLAAGAACALLAGAHFWLPEASIFQEPRTSFGFSRYKVVPAALRSAREVLAIAPEGPMLAPGPLAGMIVALDSNYPQVRIGKDPLRVWMYAQGRGHEAEQRIRASDYLQGRPAGEFSALDFVLRENADIRSIVAATKAYRREELRALLEQYGFQRREAIAGYMILWK